MAKATVRFTHLVQDSQEYGSDNEHMVSRAFFDLDLDGSVHPGLHCDIKQTVGSSFETAPLEISRPFGYRGPFNHQAFSEAVEGYYRSLVGAQGRGIRIEGNAANIRMMNNQFHSPAVAEFAVDPSSAGW